MRDQGLVRETPTRDRLADVRDVPGVAGERAGLRRYPSRLDAGRLATVNTDAGSSRPKSDVGAPDTASFRLRDGAVVWRVIDGGVVALDLDGSVYLSLNASGSALWALIAAGATHRQLVDELLTRFEVAPEQAEADVDAFLRTCADRKFLDE